MKSIKYSFNQIIYFFTARQRDYSLCSVKLICILFFGQMQAQEIEEQFIIKSEYLVTLPSKYHDSVEKQWPVLIFLHGSRENSTLEKVKNDFLPVTLSKDKTLPLILISPVNAYNKWSVDILNKMLDDVIDKYNVNLTKIFLSGHSMGGWATWEWALESPERFAAIAPISGSFFRELQNPWKLRHLPIWVFHGEKDQNIDVSNNIKTISLVKKYNNNAKITIYPDAGHDIWDWPFKYNNVIRWMLNQSKGNTLQVTPILNKNEYKSYCGIYTTNNHKDSMQVRYEKSQLRGKDKYGDFIFIPESKNMFYLKSEPWVGIEFILKENKVIELNILENHRLIKFDKVD